VQDPQGERLLEAIKELTAEIRGIVEKIRKHLREMEKKGLRRTNGGTRKRTRRKPSD
jgi:hypothetical protein